MTKQYSTWLLYLLAVAITALCLSLETTETGKANRAYAVAEAIFPGLADSQVQEIALTNGAYQTILSKGVRAWHVTSWAEGRKLVEDFADLALVDQLVTELTALQPAAPTCAIQSRQPAAWDSYGLGALAQARGQSLRLRYGSLSHTLYLGGSVPNVYPLFLLYARRDDEPRLLTITARLRQWLRPLAENPDFMRSRKPFHLSAALQPDHISLKNPLQQKFSLERRQDEWRYRVGDAATTNRADQEAGGRLVKLLGELPIHRFVYPSDPNAHQRQFLEGGWIIGCQTAEDEEFLAVGTQEQIDGERFYHTARLFYQGDEQKIAYCHLILAKWIEPILQAKDRLPDRRIARFDPRQVVTIVRRGARMNWLLAIKMEQWQVTAPVVRDVKNEAVVEFLRWLAEAQSSQLADVTANTPQLDESLTLELTEGVPIDGVPTKASAIAIAWSPLPLQSEPHLYPVQLAGETAIRLVDAATLSQLDKQYLDFYNKRVDAFVYADVVTVKVVRPDRTYEIYRDGEMWRLRQPVAAPAEAEHVDELLRNCAWIMATAVLGEGEAAREQYGCRDAAYRLQIETKPGLGAEAVSRSIEVGQELPDQHCAIWISGFPFVYQVGLRLKTALTREFHHCGWLPAGCQLPLARRIELIRPQRHIVWENLPKRTANLADTTDLAPAKRERLMSLLARLRVAQVLQFAGTPEPSGANRPELLVKVTCASEAIVELRVVREGERLLATLSGSDNLLLLENEAAAVLLQETE